MTNALNETFIFLQGHRKKSNGKACVWGGKQQNQTLELDFYFY